MRTLMTCVFAASLGCGPGLLVAGQQSPSSGSAQNSQDVPHQEPGTDSPDLGKQRVPAPKVSPGQNNPSTKSPAQGTPDVPHQEPGTNNPDLGKERRGPSGTGGTSTHSKTRSKQRKNKSTASQTQTNTSS